MNLKSIFKPLEPAPIIEPIQDQTKIDKFYKHWRIRVAYSMYIGYIVYYLTRKNFTYAMPFLSNDLNFSKAELGIIATTLYITYGISRFVSSIISDRSNPRYFMAYGLIISGLLNICFGFTSSIFVMCILWGVNGFFQAWGWPPCTKILSYWFSKKERGFWWGLISTSHALGGSVIPIIATFLAVCFSWRFALIIPGVFSIFIGIFLINRLRDIPETLGLPNIEEYKNRSCNNSINIDNNDKNIKEGNKESSKEGNKEESNDINITNNSYINNNENRKNLNSEIQNNKVNKKQNILSVKNILIEVIFSKPLIWMLGLTYFFVYGLRMVIDDWMPFYFIEAKNLSPVIASSSVTWFEAAGFFGMIFAGWCSDKIFKGKRFPLVIFSCILGIITLHIFSLNISSYIYFDFFCVAVLGFCVFACHMLIGISSAEMVDKNAAATSHGFITFFGYIGASFAGYPIGKFIDKFGWVNFLYLLLIGFGLLLFITSTICIAKKKISLFAVNQT